MGALEVRGAVAVGGGPADAVADHALYLRVVIDGVGLVPRLEVEDLAVAAAPDGARSEHLAALKPADEQQLIGLGDPEGLAIGLLVRELNESIHALGDGVRGVDRPHAAQIAAVADEHYLIVKNETDGRMQTSLKPLDKNGRIEELARIIGGVNITDKTRETAKEMLETV